MWAPGGERRRLSRRDLELLSAYLDGELGPRRKAKLESRLEREPELRLELEELRRTVESVRSLPRVGAPRPFTLTPEHVLSGQKAPGINVITLASAVGAAASAILVLVGVLMALGLWPAWGTTARSALAPTAEFEMALEPTTVPASERVSPSRTPAPLTPVPATAMPTSPVLLAEEEAADMAPEGQVEAAIGPTQAPPTAMGFGGEAVGAAPPPMATPMAPGAVPPVSAPVEQPIPPTAIAPTQTPSPITPSPIPAPTSARGPVAGVPLAAPYLIGAGILGVIVSLALYLSGRGR